MGKIVRTCIAIIMLLGLVLLARNNVAWAATPASRGDQLSGEKTGLSAALDRDKNCDKDRNKDKDKCKCKKGNCGSVKPPSEAVTACKDGLYSLGGVSTLEIKDLARGYCLVADLWNHAFSPRTFPEDVGKALARITLLRVFYHGELVEELPTKDGTVQICYAVPPKKEGQLYFLDFYAENFGRPSDQAVWVPVETTVEGGMACAAAQLSGAYALIGK